MPRLACPPSKDGAEFRAAVHKLRLDLLFEYRSCRTIVAPVKPTILRHIEPAVGKNRAAYPIRAAANILFAPTFRVNKQGAFLSGKYSRNANVAFSHSVRPTPERGRLRFPHPEPIGPHRRHRVASTAWGRVGSGRAACPCRPAIDCVCSPKTSKGGLPGAISARHPSSLG